VASTRSEGSHSLSSSGPFQPDLRIVSIYGPDDTLENVDRNAALSSPVSLDELRELVTANLDHPSAR